MEQKRLAEQSQEIQCQLSDEANWLNAANLEQVSRLQDAIRVENEFQQLQREARSLGQLQQLRDATNMKRNQLVRHALVYKIE